MRRRLQVIPDASSMELPFLHPGTVRLIIDSVRLIFLLSASAGNGGIGTGSRGEILLWPQ